MELHQDLFVFLLDGLDETKSKKLARNVFSKGHYSKCLAILFTRPEGKEYLDTDNLDVLEFTLEDLTPEQFEKFVRNYPFDDDVEQKIEQLLSMFRQNKKFQKVTKVPFCGVLATSLFNDNVPSLDINEEIDIFTCLFAHSIKSEELGYALFKCNGNRIFGFEDCDVKKLREHLKTVLPEKEVNSVLRLRLFEIHTQDKGELLTELAQFYHRNPRELSIAMYIVFNQEPLDTSEITKFRNPGLAIVRCVLSLYDKLKLEPSHIEKSLEALLSSAVPQAWTSGESATSSQTCSASIYRNLHFANFFKRL
jgi:hypothetical protein